MANQKTIFVTNKGTAMYPWLNQPDTQFDADGVYKCNLILPEDHTKELRKQVDKVVKEEFGDKAKNVRLPFKTDDETGHAIIVTKSKFQPKFCDASGQIMTGSIPKIWGGSTLKLGGYISPYSAGGNIGISLHLTKVQIINPVSGDSNDGITFGEEEGFLASNQDQEVEFQADFKADNAPSQKYNF